MINYNENETENEKQKKKLTKKACIGQNALSQSDCSFFKSAIFPEQIVETASFFTF